MKRINNFSGGLCSFWSAYRDVQEVGALNVVLLFADTLMESESTYRFIAAASEYLRVPITRVSREMTPWELFRDEKMIGNDRVPLCSIRLKREVLNSWMTQNFEMNVRQENFLMEKASVTVGFDWTEVHRLERMRQNHPTWEINAPMQEEPIWDKCKMLEEAKKLGLPLADAYIKDGLPHDNCGGGCVRAGISHWVHLYHVRPSVFALWEEEERRTNVYFQSIGIKPAYILKQTRNKITYPLHLSELRKRIEAGEEFSKIDWGGCGCSSEE